MTAPAPALVPTRSAIEAWSTAHLADAATSWRAAAKASEDAFDQHRQNIASPGGTNWEGDAKDAALNRVTADIGVVDRQSAALREAAGIAENAVSDINSAQREVLAAITAAESDDFTVGEDLSVTDNRAYDEETAAARVAAAVEHAEDIRWNAERLVQADAHVGQRLESKAADLEGIKFDGEGETDQGDPTIRLVDSKTEASGSDADESRPPGEQATGQIGPFPVPKSVEDAAKNAEGKPAGEPPAESDAGGDLGDLLGVPEEASEGKPADAGEAQPGGLPPALSQVPPPPDRAAIDRQAAKVDAARQNLDAAQAKLDAATGEAYTQGAGAGPGRDVTNPLSQSVFDARAELTEQTRVLNELNYASAASGGETAPVAPLPPNADVQAFPPPPSFGEQAAEGLTDASHDINKATFGLVPDVAHDVQVFSNWGEYSGAEQAGAVADLAGSVPVPGAKPLAEAFQHGFDVLGGSRHLDDIPTPNLDPPAPIDPPSIPVDHSPVGDMPHVDINMKDGWSEFQQSQMQQKIEAFNNAVGDQGFNQVPPVPRDPAIRQEFLDSLGLDRVPPGFHVDHTRDLQAGGLDAVENMGLLDGSVNSSFGSQLNKGMNQFPPGTTFGGVRLPDP